MPAAQLTTPVSINIRAKIRQRDLIDQAAHRLGRSRSDFMLEVACRAAEDVLLDQAFFTVDAGNGFDYMMPLRELVGNARVVAVDRGMHQYEVIAQLARDPHLAVRIFPRRAASE